MSNNLTMKFLELTKRILKIKKENNKIYSTNPYKQNKQVTLIWIEPRDN